MKNEFIFPSTGVAAAKAILLAIDDVSLPLRRFLCKYMTKPTVRREPVLTPSPDRLHAPDGVCAFFYGAVIQDGGRFRMWYYAAHHDEQQKTVVEGPTCYAESDDGIHWVKPALRQVEWRGSLDNNIIKLAHLRSEGVHVIKDDDDPDPNRRYKMVYNYMPPGWNCWSIRTATSPDGLHWTDGGELPYDGFIEQGSFYKHNGLYFVNGQTSIASEGGHDQGRQAFVIVSPDFRHWLQEQGESFLVPEPPNPQDRGYYKPYEQVHIGVGAASFGNVLVGLYCQWHNRPNLEKNDVFGYGTTSGDFGLVVSNDGQHFREPVKGHVWLRRQDSPVHLPGVPHELVMCQGNGILNVGDETRIYHGRWANAERFEDYWSEVALATLPRDRWGALGLYGEHVEGSVWSCPITLPNRKMEVTLNADDAYGISIEIADEKFQFLPEFSGEKAGKTRTPRGLDCPVVWSRGELGALGGRTVRFRAVLRRQDGLNPRLYAINLR